MRGLFEVIYDGASRPIIKTPSGRFLSLSQFEMGRWVSYGREDSDCNTIVAALNRILTNSPEIIAEWKAEEQP